MAITVTLGGWVHQTTGTLTPTYPAGWAADDILIFFLEQRGTPAWSATGWTQISAQDFTGGGVLAQLRTYWRRAVVGDTNPVGPFDGNSGGLIVGFRGCIASGTPYEALGGGGHTTADTVLGPTGGITTLGSNRLLVYAGARTGDDGTDWVTADATPSGAANFVERVDAGWTDGQGGGVALWTADAAAAQAYGGLTGTKDISSNDGWTTFALIPAVTSSKGAQAVGT